MMADRNEATTDEEEEIVEEEVADEEGSPGHYEMYYEEEVFEEEVVEDDPAAAAADGEYEDQVVEPWIGRNSEPENYQLAVLALIAVLYKDDDTTDIANMMTRTPLPELYKYLKQQYWYKMHTDQAAKAEAVAASAEDAAEAEQHGPGHALSVDEVLKIRMKGLVKTKTPDEEEVVEEVVEENEEEEVVEEEVIDEGLPVIGEDEELVEPLLVDSPEEVEEEEEEEEVLEEEVLDDGHIVFEDDADVGNVQKVRRRDSQDDYTTEEEVVSADNSVASGEGEEYEEQVIERWVCHDEDPEDMEAAVAGLITVVYKDDDEVDVESMVRRSSLPELYKYLKQQYWYKVHTDAAEAAAAAKELEQVDKAQEESTPLRSATGRVSRRMSVDDMVANRLQGLEREFSARAFLDDDEEADTGTKLDGITEDVGESQEFSQEFVGVIGAQ